MSWEDLAAQMDATVDAAVGDAIELSTNSGASFQPVQGFVAPYVAGMGIGGFDEPLGSRNRVKLLRSYFADGVPGRDVRLRSPRLGAGTFRPASSEPEEQGRYVLFDVQKVE